MRNAHASAVLLSIVGLVGLSACGPISALSSVRKATIAIESAEIAEAPKTSPYEFQLAQEYLKKAREEQGYADYQEAIDLAVKALEFAEKARRRALAVPTSPTPAAEAPDGRTNVRKPVKRVPQVPVPVRTPITPAPTQGVR
ncbi:MAG: DUF4398 domain-containing protein [Myxococcota bacterium]|nr:DUF4398 domain-containing protein [Myxococcota bacterium]